MNRQCYALKVPKDEEITEEYMVDEEFLIGLGRLEDLKTREQDLVKSILNEVSIKTGGISGVEPLNQLFDYVKKKIAGGDTGRDRHLPSALEKIMLLSEDIPYYIRRRSPQWVKDTDFSHTTASLIYTSDICKDLHLEDKLQKIVMSAMIVHDCAYPKVGSYEEFTSEWCRKEHMENAVKEFQRWAEEINRNFKRRRGKEYYTDKDIEQVCRIVSQHDNPSLKLDFNYEGLDERLIFAHREADRLWMLNEAGFALDLLREIIEKSKYDPAARLDYVIEDHIKETLTYKALDNKLERYNGAPTIYRTKKGFEIFLKSIDDIMNHYPRARIYGDIKEIEECIGNYRVDYELSTETVGNIMRELEGLKGEVETFAGKLKDGEELACFLEIYDSLYRYQPVLSYAAGPYTGKIDRFMNRASQKIGPITDSEQRISIMNGIYSEVILED